MKLIFFLNIFVFTPWPVKKHEKKTTNDDGRQGFVPDRSTWSLLFELTRLIFQNYWSNLLCYCSRIHQCGSESMNVDMVVGPFLFMCFSNQNINITKRFYGRKNIILEYYCVTEEENQRFPNFTCIAALCKQLFAHKYTNKWDTALKCLPSPTNARMLHHLLWSGRSVSISEAKISASEVRVHTRVRKVAKKVGCPRNL